MKGSDSSLERIYPADSSEREIAGADTFLLHIERYRYAAENLVPGFLADIACGSGYGSYVLATEGNTELKKIFAVDNNEEAIAYAKKKYQHSKIEFILNDAFTFQPSHLLNTIISLETIEHLTEPEKFVLHLSSFLATGGRFIASAPVTPSMDANPYHLHDFTITSFKRLFTNANLQEIDSFVQVQKYSPFKLIFKKQGRANDIRKNLPLYYITHPGKFFLRISSLFKNGFTNKYLVVIFEKSK